MDLLILVADSACCAANANNSHLLNVRQMQYTWYRVSFFLHYNLHANVAQVWFLEPSQLQLI